MKHLIELYKMMFVSYHRLDRRDRIVIGAMYLASALIMFVPMYLLAKTFALIM